MRQLYWHAHKRLHTGRGEFRRVNRARWVNQQRFGHIFKCPDVGARMEQAGRILMADVFLDGFHQPKYAFHKLLARLRFGVRARFVNRVHH